MVVGVYVLVHEDEEIHVFTLIRESVTVEMILENWEHRRSVYCEIATNLGLQLSERNIPHNTATLSLST